MLATKIQKAVQSQLVEAVQSAAIRKYSSEYSERLAAELTQLLDAEACLLLSSGTAALEVALRAAQIGPGDMVIMSAYDYPGNFWAVERVGARPLLIDIQADGWQLDYEQVASLLSSGVGSCKALVASHLHGELQDSERLRAICDSAGWVMIEDCCQALGARQADGGPLGSLADFVILSFGGGKTVSAGRGGALLVHDAKLGQRARLAAGAGSGPYYLSEMQAVVVLAQLAFLSSINTCTRRYFGGLASDLPVMHSEWTWHMPADSMQERAAYYQAGWLVEPISAVVEGAPPSPTSIDTLIQALRSRGIPAGHGFAGFHRRSSRRCDTPLPLRNTANQVERTLVIHHSVALAGDVSTV